MADDASAPAGSVGEVFLAALMLGLTSFGGPTAHIGYFRQNYVLRRRWLSDQTFAELLALCQALPGPASSQLGFAIGWVRAGLAGALAAWAGFTLPSALLMLGFAFVAEALHGPIAAAVIHGLKLAAVAVVAQAVLGMARTLVPDRRRAVLAAGAAAAMLAAGSALAQLLVILAAAILGAALCPGAPRSAIKHLAEAPSPTAGGAALGLFAILLIALPLIGSGNIHLALANVFYRAGALVFGGGHVVLPLLREGLVPQLLGDGAFLAGYGAAQALPGPLFTIAAFLGAAVSPETPLAAAAVATVTIFLPGLLLVVAALAFRQRLAANRWLPRVIAGVNAAVVGILTAALYDPLWATGVADLADAAIALGGFVLLTWRRSSPLLVVALSVAAAVARTW